VPFIGKADRDPIALESPEFLDQAIVQFVLPFPGEKSLCCLSPLKKFGSISPVAVCGLRYRYRVPQIPGVLG
jgi:hypothetical protein